MAVIWSFHTLGETPPDWDEILSTSPDGNVFQCASWAAHKSHFGWTPLFCQGKDANGRTACLALVLLKKTPVGVKLAWSSGGPVFIPQKSQRLDPSEAVETLVEELFKKYKYALLRFNSFEPYQADHSYSFTQVFRRSWHRINSGYSVSFDLKPAPEAFLKGMTSKHRYYVKKALESGMTWKFGNEESLMADFLAIYAETAQNKKIAASLIPVDCLKDIGTTLKDQHRILIGYHQEKPVTGCFLLTMRDKAWYYAAATGGKGRELSASYAMIYELYRSLRENGTASFDFGGIAPGDASAAGVDHFKTGFGGKIIEYLGEWEISSPRWIRLPLNAALALTLH